MDGVCFFSMILEVFHSLFSLPTRPFPDFCFARSRDILLFLFRRVHRDIGSGASLLIQTIVLSQSSRAHEL